MKNTYHTHRKEWATLGDVSDFMAAAARSEAPSHRTGFFASQFGLCHRRMVLERAGVPGRPMSIESIRNLKRRGEAHDAEVVTWKQAGICIAGDTGTAWTNKHQTTRLSDAFPEGFGCRADAICHGFDCDCDTGPTPLTMAWGRLVEARKAMVESEQQGLSVTIKYNGTEYRRFQLAQALLAKHKLRCVELKTAHPALVNHSDKLPKPPNVLQARAAAWAIRRLYGLEVKPTLVYYAVGSNAKSLEFDCGGGPEDTFEDIEREIACLLHEWSDYQATGELPPIKPLGIAAKKEVGGRAQFFVRDYECVPLYCPFAPPLPRKDGEIPDDEAYQYEDAPEPCYVCPCSRPLDTEGKELKGGQRFSYLEPDGTTLWVEKWAKAANIPCGSPSIANPRGKADGQTAG